MKVFHNQDISDVKVGDLLISEPLLPDESFSRSVVLICDATDDTHFGFVINKAFEGSKLQDVAAGFENFDKDLLIGGPVQQEYLQLVHCYGWIEGAHPIKDGYYWGGDFEEIQHLIQQGRCSMNDFWFFLGYSGWSEGQLKKELSENSWLVSSQKLDEVMCLPLEKIWKKSIKSLGSKFHRMSDFPIDPRLN